MDGRQGHRPRAVRAWGPRCGRRLPRHGPARARAQALRSGSARHDRSPGLWPLDAAGAAGRGQRGDAAIPGGGEVMAVAGLEITLRRPLAGGAPFGDVGPYEELKGRLAYAIDPSHAANRGVTDVALAPRNAAGLVEFSADLSLLVPVDRARASGRALIDVVNRGNTVSVPNFNHATRPAFVAGSDPNPPIDVGDGFLMCRGYVVASCGWQFDLPDVPGLIRLHGVEAREQGQPLRGRVYVQLQAPEDVADFLLSDRAHHAYAAADLDERDAVLTVRDMPDAEPEVVPRAKWKFARVDNGRVTPDPRHVALDGGFARGRLYHLAYTATGAQ